MNVCIVDADSIQSLVRKGAAIQKDKETVFGCDWCNLQQTNLVLAIFAGLLGDDLFEYAIGVTGGGDGHGNSHGRTIGRINPRVIGDGVGKVQWQGPLSERSLLKPQLT